MSDTPRLLARRSEFGYVGLHAKALPGVGEAVSEDYQAELSLHAELREREQRVETLEQSRERVQRELTWHMSRVRALERDLRRLARKINGSR